MIKEQLVQDFVNMAVRSWSPENLGGLIELLKLQYPQAQIKYAQIKYEEEIK